MSRICLQAGTSRLGTPLQAKRQECTYKRVGYSISSYMSRMYLQACIGMLGTPLHAKGRGCIYKRWATPLQAACQGCTYWRVQECRHLRMRSQASLLRCCGIWPCLTTREASKKSSWASPHSSALKNFVPRSFKHAPTCAIVGGEV